jgi:6-pyruvoyltetrahydropterin/6-carboxytetrahydropterin synthase
VAGVGAAMAAKYSNVVSGAARRRQRRARGCFRRKAAIKTRRFSRLVSHHKRSPAPGSHSGCALPFASEEAIALALKNRASDVSDQNPYRALPAAVSKAVTFEAAHRLGRADDPAPYQRLHGHSFRLEATLEGVPDPERGWVDDLGALNEALGALVTRLDHGLLNEIAGLERPTLERICAWAAAELGPRFPALARVTVSRPSLNESCTLEVRAR